MARVKEKSKQSEKKNDAPKKYVEKNLHQHCLDGIVKILKELSRDDNVNYHVVNGTNQCSEIGSFDMVVANGSCRVGFFTMSGKHFLGPKDEGYPVKYRFTGKVSKDNWNQFEIDVDSSKVDGLDFMENKFDSEGNEIQVSEA